MTYEIAERPTPATGRGMKAARLQDQGYACAHCGRSIDMDCHLDHIIPFSRGGSNLYGNMQALCATCNLSKGNRMTRADFARGMVRNQAAAMRPAYRAPSLQTTYPQRWDTGYLVGWAFLSLLVAVFVAGRLTADTLFGPGETPGVVVLVPVVTYWILWAIRRRRFGVVVTPFQVYVHLQENGLVGNGQ
jgi:hypothetical protein